MMIDMAYQTYHEIKNLSAFNISYAKRKKINQFLTRYTFEDKSILELYSSGKAIVPNVLVGEYRAAKKAE